MIKTAAVLGATGGMGYALTEALCRRNIKTIAFARSEENLLNFKKTGDQMRLSIQAMH